MNPVHMRLMAARGTGGAKVVHVHSDEFAAAADEHKIYIGRSAGGFEDQGWGNPFRIGQDGSRQQVIDKYRRFLLQNDAMMGRIPELRGKLLGCWCHPAACHGDVLAALASLTDDELAKLMKALP